MKNNVIICGYPKSGNTWLVRLTAEIINCPVAGFWCQPFNKDEAIEGTNRNSDFQCFKAHYSFEMLQHTLNIYGNGTEKVIYIYRDPRSVSVSASHYFFVSPKYPRIHRLLKVLPKGLSVYNNFFHGHSHSLDIIVKGLIQGTREGAFLKIPWAEHLMGYLEKEDIFTCSYEVLSSNTLSVARQICEFLGIERTDTELNEAIQRQSFERKKERFEAEGNKRQSKFLRKGKTQAWKEELSGHNIKYIENEMGGLMMKLGYELTSNFEQ